MAITRQRSVLLSICSVVGALLLLPGGALAAPPTCDHSTKTLRVTLRR
jgi:hypothetical protein